MQSITSVSHPQTPLLRNAPSRNLKSVQATSIELPYDRYIAQGCAMVQASTRYITQAEFEQLCLEHPDRVMERTAQGELVEMSPVGGEGGSREADLVTTALWASLSRPL